MPINIPSKDFNGFDPSTMVPGEAVAFSANDPTATDGKSLNVAFDKDSLKRILTYDDLTAPGVLDKLAEDLQDYLSQVKTSVISVTPSQYGNVDIFNLLNLDPERTLILSVQNQYSSIGMIRYGARAYRMFWSDRQSFEIVNSGTYEVTVKYITV